MRLPPEDRDPQRLAEALKVLEAPFKVLDGALAGTPYLLGDDFTVADLNVAAVISRAIDMDLSATPRHAATGSQRCLERPAARARRAALRAREGRRRWLPVEVTAGDRPAQSPVSAWRRPARGAMPKRSAGILMYRQPLRRYRAAARASRRPVLGQEGLGAPGRSRKGEYSEGEDPLTVAKREFEEETGARPERHFLGLGNIVQAGRKIVTAWAVEGDFDPATLKSNDASSWNGRRERPQGVVSGSRPRGMVLAPPPPAGKSSRRRASSSRRLLTAASRR